MKKTSRQDNLEWTRKQREAHIGKRHSEETKKKMSKTRTGHLTSEATRIKIGSANKIRMTGKRHSEETKKKMSLSRKGRVLSAEDKLKKSIAAKNRPPRSLECREKLRQNALKMSAESRERGNAKKRGRKHAPEHIEKIRIGARKAKLLSTNINRKYRDTDIERAIESELAKRGIPFEKQKAIAGFRVDFYLKEHSIVLECDGCYHHCCPDCKPNTPAIYAEPRHKRDEFRETTIIQAGYEFFRFWGHEIKLSTSDCIDQLRVNS